MKALPKTYGIDILKGYFPKHFNRPENQNYIGKILEARDFGVDNMMPEDYHKIEYEKDGETIEKETGFFHGIDTRKV